MSYTYDRLFFDYIEPGARASAAALIASMISDLPTRNVLDVGCGRGVWLAEWIKKGVADVVGVDGDYVEKKTLAIPATAFVAMDISSPFDLERRFDLVECLEVAEHVAPARSKDLVHNLTRHGRTVLFSAAPPGQGGENHVNEQPMEFWRGLFQEHDYHPFDFVRARIASNRDVKPWYRYNTILYVHAEACAGLPGKVLSTRVPPDREIADVAPALWRLRRRVLRHLPSEAAARLAVMKHRVAVAKYRMFGSSAR